MTRRELELLDVIRSYVAANRGVCPSMVEMTEALGLQSKSGAHRLVTSLVRQGKLRRTGVTRGYEIVAHEPDLALATDGELLAEAGRRGLIGARS